jgi:hypothetical protein
MLPAAPAGQTQGQAVRLPVVVDKSCLIQTESDPPFSETIMRPSATTPFVTLRACCLRTISKRRSQNPSAGLVSLHQRETQSLLWQMFFGWALRAGTGGAEVDGAQTFVDTSRLVVTYCPKLLNLSQGSASITFMQKRPVTRGTEQAGIEQAAGHETAALDPTPSAARGQCRVVVQS